MRKYLLSLIISVFVLVTSVFAVDSTLFPAPYTGEDGVVRWGYTNGQGEQKVGYFYTAAAPFSEHGFAVVRNAHGLTGVIDGTGSLVVERRETPLAVEFAPSTIAFRYEGESIYFNEKGEQIGVYEGAHGFFDHGLLRVQRDGGWGYVRQDGTEAIAPTLQNAGDFYDGRALVQNADGTYAVLLASGVSGGLPGEPAELSIRPGSLIVLKEDYQYRLYSLALGTYLTDGYDQMTVNDDGYVTVQQEKKWGILSPGGKITVEPQYYYLSYMGEGMYAARGAEGTAVAAIDGEGTRLYTTDTYVGGFETFRFGLSWHGTMDGGVMFFNKNGVLTRKLEGASNPVILTENVVSVTVNGETEYVRLSDGKVLYAPVRAYTLEGGVKVQTKAYEKYIGMEKGVEYGWRLSYPQFSGMKDTKVQQKINSAIEKFFLDGPDVPAQKESLVGSYGFAFHGRLLVVYADARRGLGEGGTIWNDSIALDYGTGDSYAVPADLLNKGAEEALMAVLPPENPFYLYSAPRITGEGLLYYISTAATASTPASVKEYKVPYSSIKEVINTEGACYRALTGDEQPVPPTPLTDAKKEPTFRDVPASHWAYTYIEDAAARGLMSGADGAFQPEAQIIVAEAAVVLARALALPEGSAPGITAAWYAGEYGGAYAAGILAGLETKNPEEALIRVDAMQLFANALRRETPQTLAKTEVDAILSTFTDASALPTERQEAAAFCIKAGVISGAEGKLSPQGTLTRAEFTKLLSTIEIEK